MYPLNGKYSPLVLERFFPIISQPLLKVCSKLPFYLDSTINLSRVFSVTESKKLNFALFCSAAGDKSAQIDFCQQYLHGW